MKLPSLGSLAREAARTFRRFPVVILDACAGTIAAIMLINREFNDRGGPEERIFLAALCGVAFTFAIAVFAERRGWTRTRILVAQAAGAAALILYGLTLPAAPFIPPFIHITRFWVLFIAAHLLVAFAPFVTRGETNGFWQYNRILFLRSLTAMLYALVLYAGLAIALAAIDNLFTVHVPSERYFELFAVITGLFMTWFFLSGVPPQIARLETESHYPKALKIFTQYVLIPLVVVYLLILYAYMGKILITWDWPQGWVGNLVLGFSIAGIFSLLLVYPIQSLAENVWIRSFGRRFHFAIIPLIGLLLLAVWRRVGEYGMTENRYFVIVLGFWLAAMVVMAFATGGKHIKAIPLSLFLVAILASWGPWSAFAVSERSQRGRLMEILERNGMLRDGKAHAPSGELAYADIREISAVITYMLRVHELDALQPLFEKDLRPVVADSGTGWRGGWYAQAATNVVHLLGIEYAQEWRAANGGAYYFSAQRRGSLDVSGYDLLFSSVALSGQGEQTLIAPDSANYVCALADSGTTLQIARGAGSVVRIPFRPMVDSLFGRYARTGVMFSVSAELMCIRGKGEGLSAAVYAHSLQVERRGTSVRVTTMEADILIKGEDQ